MKNTHILPSAGRIIALVLLAVFLIGCGQPNVNVDIGGSKNSQPPEQQSTGGGCGVSSMEDYTDVTYPPINGAL